ncbi:hypothetical protein LZ318_29660 [Saccharopolyspora indica]|uniref:hypothetical protein n=1 Tax=Saccharopolyspora indica TaxID=1229659 RepID=UPI0022EB750B|nr:hypothetical protein [Saccharopolyspora indica]MDA3646150.1 hypothetical protein [Saccharopolyspora indica]
MSTPELTPFDPLAAFAGSWTTKLAERYLPVPDAPPAKYECLDGTLILTPHGGVDVPFARWTLGKLLEAAAAERGHQPAACTDLPQRSDVRRGATPCPEHYVDSGLRSASRLRRNTTDDSPASPEPPPPGGRRGRGALLHAARDLR